MTKKRRRGRDHKQSQGRDADGKTPRAPEITEALDENLDIDLVGVTASGQTADGHADIQLVMVQTVLRRTVELKLAQWTETVLLILRDEFGFTQEQLALFAREFRERSSEQATETSTEETG